MLINYGTTNDRRRDDNAAVLSQATAMLANDDYGWRMVSCSVILNYGLYPSLQYYQAPRHPDCETGQDKDEKPHGGSGAAAGGWNGLLRSIDKVTWEL